MRMDCHVLVGVLLLIMPLAGARAQAVSNPFPQIQNSSLPYRFAGNWITSLSNNAQGIKALRYIQDTIWVERNTDGLYTASELLGVILEIDPGTILEATFG